MKNKRKGTIKIFKFLFVGIIGIFTLGCNPDNPEPNGTLTMKYNVTIDGQNYTWQNTYPENTQASGSGSAYFNSNTPSQGIGNIFATNDGGNQLFTININKQNLNGTGNYSFSSSNFNTNSSNFTITKYSLPSIAIYSNQNSGSINLNVTTFPTSTANASNASNSAILKSTFSGTLGNINGGTSNINGSVEVVRIQ
jgi:hypothetical protein